MPKKKVKGYDYFRAETGTPYTLSLIKVAVDPVSGPWLLAPFFDFTENGTVRVFYGIGENTAQQFKFWTYPFPGFDGPGVYTVTGENGISENVAINNDCLVGLVAKQWGATIKLGWCVGIIKMEKQDV